MPGRLRFRSLAVLSPVLSLALASGPGLPFGMGEISIATAAPRVITTGPETAPPATPASTPIRWHSLGSGLDEAKRARRPVLVDVVTDWCGWCKRMEKTTYTAAPVREYVGRTFVAIKLDAEDDEARARYDGRIHTTREFADRFRITGYPTTLFLGQDGRLITMVPGYVKPERFMTVLRYIGDGHYRNQSFEAYSREADASRP